MQNWTLSYLVAGLLAGVIGVIGVIGVAAARRARRSAPA
jgi:uncharacterized membrane protein YtjA (UPF0391 family)